MTRHCTISRNSNSEGVAIVFLVLNFLLFSQNSFGQFRAKRDREIVFEILRVFKKECNQKVSSDEETLARIETEALRARQAKPNDILKCFEGNLSQITGVYSLYSQLCNDISAQGKNISDFLAAKELVAVNKYQIGIRPFQAALNDCLSKIPEKNGLPFVVPVVGVELDVKVLEKQLENVVVDEPFPATGFPTR